LLELIVKKVPPQTNPGIRQVNFMRQNRKQKNNALNDRADIG
jgi:hypothetical protein